MKFTKLLVLGAMLLSGSSAWAALVNGERVKPEPTGVTFQTGSTEEIFYLYNTSAKMFFTEGNTWGTRGCVGPYASAVKMYFSEGEEGSYVINNYICIRSTSYSWKVASAEATGTSVYTDQSTSWGRPYWMLVDGEGSAFRLRNVSVGEEPKFMGRDDAVPQDFSNAYSGFTDDSQRFPLSDAIEEGDGHHIDWILVSAEAYEALGPSILAWEAADALLTLIKEAEELGGIDVTDYRTLYANEEATIDELKAAVTPLTAAIEQRKKDMAEDAYNNASAANPADVTEKFMVNPYYDGNANGWTSNPAPAVNANGAEFYEKDFTIYQELTLGKAGVYSIGVQGYNRPGSTADTYRQWTQGAVAKTKFFYAVGTDTTSTTLVNIFEGSTDTKIGVGTEYGPNGTDAAGQSNYVPNNMAAAKAYFDAGRYKNILFISAAEDQMLKVGLEHKNHVGMDWVMFDNWSLIYYGAGADAYQKWVEEMAAAAPVYTAESVTATLVDAYMGVKNAPAATNEAEAKAYLANLEAARAAVAKNIALWAQYSAAVVEAQDFVKGYVNQGQGGITQVAMLNAYVNQSFGPNQAFANGSAAYIMQALALENEALETEIAFLASLKKAVIDNVAVKPGTDVTSRLTNPAFDTNDWTGWTHQAAPADPGQNTNVRVGEYCCEAWNNASFNIYQEVTDMPVGIYEISVQGFYRQLRGNNAWSTYQDAPNLEVPTYIYMNDNTTPFKNVFSEPVVNGELYTATDVYTDPNKEYWYPDGMASSAQAFNANMYMNSAYGAVVNSTDVMRLGVKGSSNQGHDSWVIFDNFKLTFWGKQADKVKPALEQAIAEVEALQAGRMGKNVKEDVATAILNGQEAAQGEDGDVMFNALVALYSAKAKVADSKALMDQLALVNDSLGVAVSAAQMDAVLGAALTLYEQVANKLSEQDIADDEVAALIEQIHAQMAIADKCVELKDALTDLEEKAQVTQEEKEQGEVSEQWENQANDLLGLLAGQIEDGSLDVTKIDEYLEQIKQMISTKYMPADMDSATDENPVVCTKMLAAPNFSVFNEESGNDVASLEGWTYTDGYEAQDYLMLGYYNKTFDVYQELAGIPNGTYEVKAQGFYRFGASQEDADMFFQTKADSSNVFLYATSAKVTSSVAVKLLASGGVKTQIGTTEEVIDEGTGESVEQFTPTGSQVRIAIVANPSTAEDSLYVPNNVQAAAAFFKEKVDDANRFENSVIVKVTDGTLRLGIKKNTGKGNDWSIFDNFRLIYYGANSTKNANDDPSGIERTENATAKVLRTEYFMFNGVRTANVQKGMAIVRQIMSDGTVVVKKVNLK